MPATGQPIRYAIYTRQSVDRPADFSSCEAQFDKCHARAQGDNLQWVGERFDDRGVSGGTLDRPALTRLRKLVASGGVDRIFVSAMDRLSRRAFDLVALLEEFEKSGVSFHVAHGVEPPPGAQARFMRHMLGVFAQFERELIADRIAETRAYLKAHGRRIAGPVPFGYAADPKSRQLVIIPREARRVRLIFERVARGQTPAQIAARINHLKWRTKSWVAHRSGKPRGGGKWTARVVLRLLRNPVYTGRHRDQTGTRQGCHAPIVDLVLFERVQAILDRRRTVTRPKRQSIGFPLRGRIRCPKCGRPLSTQLSSRRLGKGRIQNRVYCCRSSAGGRAPCRGVRYRAFDVEHAVCGTLGEESTWRGLLTAEHATEAHAFAMIWSSLGHSLQNAFIGQMVDLVTFGRKNAEMRITFNPRCRELLNPQNGGIS